MIRFIRKLLGFADEQPSGAIQARPLPSPKSHDRSVRWGLSEQGNPFFTQGGWRVTVSIDSGGSGELWKFCAVAIDELGNDIDEPFFSEHYFTMEDAKADAERFHFHQPTFNNTFQTNQDEQRRNQVTAVISAEMKRISILRAKIKHGQSISEDVLKDAEKYLNLTEAGCHCAQIGGATQARFDEFESIAIGYKSIIEIIMSQDD